MVRTRGGSRVRPRVRFSTPEREAAAPSAQSDGSSTGQGCYNWSSPLSEAASASYAAHRPSTTHLLIPSAALCAEEGAYLGGIVPDLGQFLVQPIRASDDFTTAF